MKAVRRVQESTIQDEVEDFIVSMLDQGFTKSEIIEKIPEVFEGFDIGLASDAYEDYERDNDPANEEATVGDIESFLDELESEGFPRDEAIERAMKRYKLTAQEIRSMTEGKARTAEQAVALEYLDKLESVVGKIAEAYPRMGALNDEDPNAEIGIDLPPPEAEDETLTSKQIAEMMDSLVNEEGWDEEEAATYIVETEMSFDSEEEEADLIGQVIDTFYDEMYNK